MSEDTRPRFEPIWLACKGCGHRWDDWQPTNVPLATWAAHVKTYHCPLCRADCRNLVLRTKPLEEAPGFG